MRINHFPALRRIGLIVPVALVLTLAACGVTTTSEQPGGTTSGTPTATAASTATSGGGTPVSSVPPTGAVTLTTDQASYTSSSTILVTLTNHRATSIFAFDHQTSCTILTLQRQTSSGWQPVGGCALGRMTVQVEIHAGANMKITLAPAAGQIHPTPWPAGTYRAVLNYSLQKQEMATGDTATTPTFAIH